MSKSILKEIIIMLLLILAIIIVLGLLLYDYVPMSKVVPEPVSYVTPEGVKEELIESGSLDESEVIMTYEIDSTDLNNAKIIRKYKPGKANPFSTYETETQNTTNSTTTSTGTSTSTQSSSSTTSGSTTTTQTTTSGGTFFQDKGTK